MTWSDHKKMSLSSFIFNTILVAMSFNPLKASGLLLTQPSQSYNHHYHSNYNKDEKGFFAGRVVSLNKTISAIKLRVELKNLKYLSSKNRVEFWLDSDPRWVCEGVVEGKGAEYLLVTVPKLTHCIKNIPFAVGSSLNFYSQDLVTNLQAGLELVTILLKKRVAVEAKLNKEKVALNQYLEKVEVLNKRYETLRDKLELEWQEELAKLQEDKIMNLKKVKELEINLGEIDYKLERYKVFDQNMEKDRWSLDSRLYFNK